MRVTRTIIVILMLLVNSGFVWGAGAWKILRDDDFVRNDGVEGILQDVHFTTTQNGWAVGLIVPRREETASMVAQRSLAAAKVQLRSSDRSSRGSVRVQLAGWDGDREGQRMVPRLGLWN